jgi:hypothetical protein
VETSPMSTNTRRLITHFLDLALIMSGRPPAGTARPRQVVTSHTHSNLAKKQHTFLSEGPELRRSACARRSLSCAERSSFARFMRLPGCGSARRDVRECDGVTPLGARRRSTRPT